MAEFCDQSAVLSSTISKSIWYDAPMLPAQAADDGSPHRHRLLDALASCVDEKGYAATTIADVATAAKVSKRTFYEHFGDKAECLIALHDSATSQMLRLLAREVKAELAAKTQVRRALHAYFGGLSHRPVLLRTLFVEMPGLGAAGLAARRRATTALETFIISAVGGASALSPQLATAVVGGMHELILQAIEDGHADNLTPLIEPCAQLIERVVAWPSA